MATVALSAVIALGKSVISDASAEPVWLVGGALTAESVPAVIQEGLLKVGILHPTLGLMLEYECSFEFDTTVGPQAEGEITRILNLALKSITGLGGLGMSLDCVIIGIPVICTSTAKLVELWPNNLPWGTLLELMAVSEEQFLDIIGLVNGNEKEPAYDFECENSNGTLTVGSCEGQLTTTQLLNQVAPENNVLILEQDQGCAEDMIAHVTGNGLLVTPSGLLVQVSESGRLG